MHLPVSPNRDAGASALIFFVMDGLGSFCNCSSRLGASEHDAVVEVRIGDFELVHPAGDGEVALRGLCAERRVELFLRRDLNVGNQVVGVFLRGL